MPAKANHPKLDRSILKLPLALSGGRHATLADFAGRWLVLYFYPKDSTPGCTTEGLTSTRCCRNSASSAPRYWACRAIR